MMSVYGCFAPRRIGKFDACVLFLHVLACSLVSGAGCVIQQFRMCTIENTCQYPNSKHNLFIII